MMKFCLLFVAGTTLCLPAFANQWAGADGKTCPVVCSEIDLNAVNLGAVSGNPESWVCAADGRGAEDFGKRAGYVEMVDEVPHCNVYSGGQDGGFRNGSFSCLCTSQKLAKP